MKMAYKQIIPVKKACAGQAKYPYVRVTPKMLTINNEAMAMWGDTEYIRISISLKDSLMILSKAEEKDEDTFKLSRVCETKYARRSETYNVLLAILQSGFPLYMVKKRLPVQILADGSMAVDFSYKVPVKEVAI
jgi:hypothetical protein